MCVVLILKMFMDISIPLNEKSSTQMNSVRLKLLLQLCLDISIFVQYTITLKHKQIGKLLKI